MAVLWTFVLKDRWLTGRSPTLGVGDIVCSSHTYPILAYTQNKWKFFCNLTLSGKTFMAYPFRLDVLAIAAESPSNKEGGERKVLV